MTLAATDARNRSGQVLEQAQKRLYGQCRDGFDMQNERVERRGGIPGDGYRTW